MFQQKKRGALVLLPRSRLISVILFANAFLASTRLKPTIRCRAAYFPYLRLKYLNQVGMNWFLALNLINTPFVQPQWISLNVIMQSLRFFIVLLFSFLLGSFAQAPPSLFNTEIRLTNLTLYSDANACIQSCASSASFSLKYTFEQTNPATCLYTDKR